MPQPDHHALASLCNRITRFLDLRPGWDDFDAKPIPTDSVRIACCLAALGFHNGHPLPQASPSPDGEVSLSWFQGRDRLSMVVEPDGIVTWVMSSEDRVQPGGILDFSPGKDPPLDAARDVIAAWYGTKKAS